LAKFPPEQACQYLDDLCAAARAGSDDLHRLEAVYRGVAADVGVRLAPTTDPDKAFSPCTAGVVLGIAYDSVSWTWSVPAEKLARVLGQLRRLVDAEAAVQHEVWSIVGRILHYAPLVAASRFNVDLVVKANGFSADRHALVPLDAATRRQFFFWYLMFRVGDGVTSIPPPVYCPRGQLSFTRTRRGEPWTVPAAGPGASGQPCGSRCRGGGRSTVELERRTGGS